MIYSDEPVEGNDDGLDHVDDNFILEYSMTLHFLGPNSMTLHFWV